MPYNASNNDNTNETVPFQSAEDAWFWFIDAQDARSSGAKVTAGSALYPRPCETVDILKILDRLYRARRLLRDHLLVLRHYGRRKMAPDPYRAKEARAYSLWQEALETLEDVFVHKGIVEKPETMPSHHWHDHATIVSHTDQYQG